MSQAEIKKLEKEATKLLRQAGYFDYSSREQAVQERRVKLTPCSGQPKWKLHRQYK